MPCVELTLLGGYGLRRAGGGAVRLPTRKAEALVAYLGCNAGEQQPRGRLAALLWGDRSDRQARHSLSQTLLSLRRELGEPGSPLLIERESVTLRVGSVESDVAEFTKLSAVTGAARAALDLYRGPFMDGFALREPAFEDWLIEQRAGLHATAFATFLRLAEAQSAAADWEGAIATLNSAIRFDPLAEEAYRRLMAIQIERGLSNGAIRTYRTLAEALQRELKSQPDPTTTALYERALARPRPQPEARAPAGLVPESQPAPRDPAGAACQEPAGPRRASVAILPFLEQGSGTSGPLPLARGLTHDVITRLAKLRSVFVIAQGTVFALAEKGISAEEAGRMLNVDYVASGTLRIESGAVAVAIELVETKFARIVWAETIERRLSDSLSIEDEFVNRIVSSIAAEIELTERNRAILKPPASLDAWEALHCGFWHMYRFNQADNERARRFFKLATKLDPAMARAYAGLSFTHFQNAFLLRPGERREEAARAHEMARQSLIADDRDPAAHWAMGRALWLLGEVDKSLAELENAVDLSPNFALGHYALSFVHCQSGKPDAAIGYSDRARHLSPYDPMLFAMLATKALAYARLGSFDEAAEWAVKSALRPNAHTHILAIAAQCLALADRGEEARTFSARIREARPDYTIEEFLGSFHFGERDVALFRSAARQSAIFQYGR